MKNLRDSIIKMSMESISEIIDHQSLSEQLVVDTSELIAHNSGGGDPRSPSPTTTLSAHDGIMDESDAAAHHVITSTDGSSSGAAVMVRTIIDSIDHSPIRTSVGSCHSQQHQQIQLSNGHQHQQLHHNTSLQQQQTQHQQQRQRLRNASPVDFVGSDVTLDALSVGSSSSSTAAHLIPVVKQEHKLIILTNNNNNSSSSQTHMDDHHQLNVGGVNVLDELSSDAVEVTLNQHHHQQRQQQRLQQQQQNRHHTQHLHHHHHQNHHHQQHQHQQLHHPRHHQHHHHPHHHNNQTHHNHAHHEALSVIVQPHEDSRDSSSQMLSPDDIGVVGVVGGVVVSDHDNSLETSTYQTLTSVVNERMSPQGFSPTSSYATLTPLQPLPPISTMSEKFAYGGHMSGGGVVSVGSNSNGTSGGAGVNGSFAVMHGHSSGLLSGGGLSLSGLSGVQSPYSSYDKLPTMGMSMSPPHNYVSSPTHTLSGMVVPCMSQTGSPSPCGALSPQSAYSHTTELHSPPLGGGNSCGGKPSISSAAQQHHNQQQQQQKVVCLSPAPLVDGHIVVGDNVVVTGYDDSPYETHQRDLMVTTTPNSSTSGGRCSQLHLQHSPTLSPHSVSAGSVSLHSPGSCSIIGGNQSSSATITLPPINGAMATLSSASLAAATTATIMTPNGARTTLTGEGLVQIAQLQRDAVVVSLTPSPPPLTLGGGCSTPTTTLLTISNTQQQQMAAVLQQTGTTACRSNSLSQQQQQQLVNNGNNKLLLQPVTGDTNMNDIVRLATTPDPSGSDRSKINNNINNNSTMCNISSIQQHQHQQQQLQQVNTHHVNNTTNVSSSAGGSSSSGNTNGDMEEINTKELAQRISAELKRYSIPQAIFAQRVLCRSQGTLSDLLRNPKPWSKLKSGRETFRRMFKWLQEPEFQRMSALRMAAAQIPQRGGGNCSTTNGKYLRSCGFLESPRNWIQNTPKLLQLPQ